MLSHKQGGLHLSIEQLFNEQKKKIPIGTWGVIAAKGETERQEKTSGTTTGPQSRGDVLLRNWQNQLETLCDTECVISGHFTHVH